MKARFLWRAFKARYRDQAAEMSTLQESLGPGDIVCDIGANKGSYLFWLSRWVPAGQVFAFEPQKELADYLRRACLALKLNNVTVDARAVSNVSGKVNLFIPGGSDSPGASLSQRASQAELCRSVEVETVALDEYFAPGQKIGALKIDVEGAESLVFQGAQRILREQAPLLVFECENRHLEKGSVRDVFQYLAQYGYSGSFIQGNRLRPLSEFDPAVHQKQTGERFWDARDYCNNFVFKRV